MLQKISKLEMTLKKRGVQDSFLPLPVSKKNHPELNLQKMNKDESETQLESANLLIDQVDILTIF
jgi:hypothetical protein